MPEDDPFLLDEIALADEQVEVAGKAVQDFAGGPNRLNVEVLHFGPLDAEVHAQLFGETWFRLFLEIVVVLFFTFRWRRQLGQEQAALFEFGANPRRLQRSRWKIVGNAQELQNRPGNFED